MEAMLTSTAVVALAEIGDKTQLLAIVLAARYRRPLPIVLGILCATLANHALAALVGQQAAAWLEGGWFRIAVAISFIAMAGWTLVPDTFAEGETQQQGRPGAFLGTLIAFFVVEMGDKTQLATVALAARFDSVLAVTAGTTLGMMLANAPVVWFGDALIRRVPLRAVRLAAAALFLLVGLWLLAETLGWTG